MGIRRDQLGCGVGGGGGDGEDVVMFGAEAG